MSSYLAVSPLPTTVETVAGGLLSVALFPDLAIGGRYPPSYPAESGLSSKERLATLSPRPSVRLLFFSFSQRNANPTRLANSTSPRFPYNYNVERVLFNAARSNFSSFSPRSQRLYRRRVRLDKRRKTSKTRRKEKWRKASKTRQKEKRRKASKTRQKEKRRKANKTRQKEKRRKANKTRQKEKRRKANKTRQKKQTAQGKQNASKRKTAQSKRNTQKKRTRSVERVRFLSSFRTSGAVKVIPDGSTV